MREILSDLVAEQQSLDQYLQHIPWKLWDPTKEYRKEHNWPKGKWSIRDTVVHLTDAEEFTAAALAGDISQQERNPKQRFRDIIRRLAPLRPQDVIEEWRNSRSKVVGPLSRLQEDERVNWLRGSISAKSLATFRMMETWAHGLDIYAEMGEESEDTTRIRHICWLGWKTLPRAFELAGETYQPVRIEVIGPEFAKWVYGPVDTEQTIRGQASEWARLSVCRATLDQLSLQINGETALQAAKLVCSYQ